MGTVQHTNLVRNAKPSEFEEVGKLMVKVYSQIEGFPKPIDYSEYYQMLTQVSIMTQSPETELLVSVFQDNQVTGSVLFLGDVKYSGAGGTAPNERDASGFRLLVDPASQNKGIGRLLVNQCIRKSRQKGVKKVIIYTRAMMDRALVLYDNLGFQRSQNLDFLAGDLTILGFRLTL